MTNAEKVLALKRAIDLAGDVITATPAGDSIICQLANAIFDMKAAVWRLEKIIRHGEK